MDYVKWQNYTKFIHELVGIIFILLLFILIPLYIFWNIYSFKKVRFFIKERSKALEKAKHDVFGNFAELAENHKIEIVKYSFFLTINIFEGITFIPYVFVIAITYLVTNQKIPFHFPKHVETSNCTLDYLTFKNMLTISTLIPPVNFCMAIGQAGGVLTMTLCICLIKYLRNSYYKTGRNLRWILRFLLFTSFPCIAILIFSAVPSLMILGFIFVPIIHVVYLGLLIKYMRKFHRILKRQTIDLKIICKPKTTIERSVRLVKQFTIISTLNCIGIGCLITREIIFHYTFVISIVIYFAPCFSEYAYGTVFYQSLLVDPIQINQFKKALIIVDSISYLFLLTAALCISSPFFLMSFFMFGSKLWKDFRTRFKVPACYNPILTQPFLN